MKATLFLLLLSSCGFGQVHISGIDTTGRWVPTPEAGHLPDLIITSAGDTLKLENLPGGKAIAGDHGLIKPPAYRYVNLSQDVKLTRRQYADLLNRLRKLGNRPRSIRQFDLRLEEEEEYRRQNRSFP